MEDDKNEWKELLATFIILFCLCEIMLVFGMYVVMSAAAGTLLNFVDYLDKARGLCVFLTFWSFVLALGSIID